MVNSGIQDLYLFLFGTLQLKVCTSHSSYYLKKKTGEYKLLLIKIAITEHVLGYRNSVVLWIVCWCSNLYKNQHSLDESQIERNTHHRFHSLPQFRYTKTCYKVLILWDSPKIPNTNNDWLKFSSDYQQLDNTKSCILKQLLFD